MRSIRSMPIGGRPRLPCRIVRLDHRAQPRPRHHLLHLAKEASPAASPSSSRHIRTARNSSAASCPSRYQCPRFADSQFPQKKGLNQRLNQRFPNRRGPNTRLTRRSKTPATVPDSQDLSYSLQVMKNPYFPIAKQTAISTTPSSATGGAGAAPAGGRKGGGGLPQVP